MKITRLQTFLNANGIKYVQVANAKVSRQHLLRVRLGRTEPTLSKMLAIRDACSRLLGKQVYLAELFDLGAPLPIATPEHGDIFARAWYEHSIGTLAMFEAFGETNLLEWPDDPDAQVEVAE